MSAREDRNDSMRNELADGVASLTAEVKALRVQLRVTQKITTHRRRLGLYVVTVAMVALFFLHDEHVSRCGIGTAFPTPSRLQSAAMVKGRGGYYAQLCDATMPAHTYGGDMWPTGASVVGLLLYGGLLLLGGLWVRRARLRAADSREDHAA